MNRHVKIFVVSVFSLCVAVSGVPAQAGGQDEIKTEISAAAQRSLQTGSSPAQVAAFLKAQNFYHPEYRSTTRQMSGYSMYSQDGKFTPDSRQAAFSVYLHFNFDERDQLKGYEVSVAEVGR